MDTQQTEKKPQYRAIKTKLGAVIKETWSIYTKNIPGFIALFLLSVVLAVVVKMGLFSILGVNAVIAGQQNAQSLNLPLLIGGGIAFIILNWLIQLLGLNASLRGAYYVDTQGKLPLGQAFSEGLQKLGKAAGLSVRVFLYTGAWILAILGALVALGALGTFIAAQGPDNNSFVGMMAPLMSVVGFLPLVMLVVLIFLITRFCRVVFAFPILLSKEVSSKEALDESIALADGITGTIFGNYFLFGLLMAIAGGILTALVGQIVGIVYPAPQGSIQATYDYIQSTTEYAGILPSVLIGSFSLVFQYAFMKKAREEKTDQGGTPVQNPVTPAPQPTGPVLS